MTAPEDKLYQSIRLSRAMLAALDAIAVRDMRSRNATMNVFLAREILADQAVNDPNDPAYAAVHDFDCSLRGVAS